MSQRSDLWAGGATLALRCSLICKVSVTLRVSHAESVQATAISTQTVSFRRSAIWRPPCKTTEPQSKPGMKVKGQSQPEIVADIRLSSFHGR